ncbi:STY1053 family phage-associated protein [Mixta intestinalis]|uniref:Bacteriophage protein n=1 Tax=Mixta intestinalis TaxID=1615494 RepID=A0A6P1PY60_9GAMM|nr:hypothetical protein [Mixta intestinalis]QHM71283.1 hypothetical protein C7M51_01569 [Mixta intestinalis]
MKYLVNTAAVLNFPDGTKVALAPGVQDYPEKVAAHWAFSAHARPLSASDVAESEQQKTMAEQIAALKAENAEKDALILTLQAQLATGGGAQENAGADGETNPKKDGASGKKQQTANS